MNYLSVRNCVSELLSEVFSLFEFGSKVFLDRLIIALFQFQVDVTNFSELTNFDYLKESFVWMANGEDTLMNALAVLLLAIASHCILK
jgi:predicted metal-binding protein